MSPFLDTLHPPVCDSIYPEYSTCYGYGSDAAGEYENRAHLSVRLSEPSEEGCVDNDENAERDF